MQLDGRGILSAVELALYCPFFLCAAYLVFRHGFNTKLGWFYLLTLSILRIVGASTLLYAETQNDNSDGLIITVAITSAIGTAPLLLALMGFLERINTGMSAKGVSMLIFRPIHLASLAALIVAIIGGTKENSSSASDLTLGRQLMQAASIVFLAMYLSLAAITLYTVTHVRYVLDCERRLLQACVLTLPFLLVRIIFTQLVTFSGKGSIFYFRDVDVYVTALMQVAMEVVTVAIFIVAGVMTPKWEKPAKEQDVEMASVAEGRQQKEMKITDYRPSKLIRNAIANRR